MPIVQTREVQEGEEFLSDIRSSGRRLSPLPLSALEKRWKQVRDAMDEHGLDVLLVQSNNDFMGGYAKFFTDIPATFGYPVTVVFPKDDDMTVVVQGPFDSDRTISSDDRERPGTKRLLGAPYFSSAPYSMVYEAELVWTALNKYSNARIGIVSPSTMSAMLIDAVRRALPSGTELQDVTDVIDEIKAVKSEEEIVLIRETASLQDAALQAAFAAIRPGMHEYEITAIAHYECARRGSEQGLFLACSYQPGSPVRQSHMHLQARRIEKGDMFTLLVETNGPGGIYAEVGRCGYVGKVPSQVAEEHEIALAVRTYALDLVAEGLTCREIWDAYNDRLRELGRPSEQRLFFHGQGYDLVERPLIRRDEPMRLKPNMNLACHPNYIHNGMFMTICDNYLVDADLRLDRLHSIPEIVFECGE